MRRLAEIDRPKLIALLRERLLFEEQSARLHQAVIERLRTEEPAIRRILPRLEENRDQEREHAQWLEVQLRRLEAPPEPLPGSPVAERSAAEQLIADPTITVVEVLHALVAVEHEDHDAWQILGAVAERAGDLPAQQDFAKRSDEEALHVAYLKRLLAELAQNDVLGTPVTLPLDAE
jgi:bacterioferritin (cytochrome b1)